MTGAVHDNVLARVETRSPIRETERPMAVWIHVRDAVVGSRQLCYWGSIGESRAVEGQSRQSIVRMIEVKALRLARMILYCTGLVSPTVSESTNRADSRMGDVWRSVRKKN